MWFHCQPFFVGNLLDLHLVYSLWYELGGGARPYSSLVILVSVPVQILMGASEIWLWLVKKSLVPSFFRPSVPICNCFPLYVGRLKITIFHFLFSCTMIFSILWVRTIQTYYHTFYIMFWQGYLIYCALTRAVYGKDIPIAQVRVSHQSWNILFSDTINNENIFDAGSRGKY